MLHSRGELLIMLDADGATKVNDLEKLENQVGVGVIMHVVHMLVQQFHNIWLSMIFGLRCLELIEWFYRSPDIFCPSDPCTC